MCLYSIIFKLVYRISSVSSCGRHSICIKVNSMLSKCYLCCILAGRFWPCQSRTRWNSSVIWSGWHPWICGPGICRKWEFLNKDRCLLIWSCFITTNHWTKDNWWHTRRQKSCWMGKLWLSRYVLVFKLRIWVINMFI